MKTYVRDVCMTNRSDEVDTYHLTVERISQDGNKFTKIGEKDICGPCFTKMFGGKNDHA